jgi:hypothetical protein
MAPTMRRYFVEGIIVAVVSTWRAAFGETPYLDLWIRQWQCFGAALPHGGIVFGASTMEEAGGEVVLHLSHRRRRVSWAWRWRVSATDVT